MHYEDLIRAVTAAVAFTAMLAGHYIGDHWLQTNSQACKKALNGAVPAGCAVWHCVKHVASWTVATTLLFAGAAWWLHLPARLGWLAAGVAVNAVTHFVADLRTPLLWIATRLAGRSSYLSFVRVVRPDGEDQCGPGTAAFHLDQSWHIGWLLVAALLIAGPA